MSFSGSINVASGGLYLVWIVVVQSLSCVPLFVTPWTAECQVCLSFTISRSLLKLMFIESVTLSNHLVLCHPTFSFWLQSFLVSGFSNESVFCIRWPKYWSFSFRISPFKEYSGLISFRIDRFDLLAIQGILKSLYQHHSSKESILWGSAFFGNFSRDSDGKESACNVEDLGSIPGLESSPGEGDGNKLQYSCLENSMD